MLGKTAQGFKDASEGGDNVDHLEYFSVGTSDFPNKLVGERYYSISNLCDSNDSAAAALAVGHLSRCAKLY